MRDIVIQTAIRVFFFSKASMAYSEQVGTNRPDGGQRGERYRL
jgi:hypothetical protein